MDQDTILNKLKEIESGSKRRFFEYPGYGDTLWLCKQIFFRINAKLKTNSWFDTTAMQTPTDYMSYMECLYQTKPKVFIETGTCAGEGTLFYTEILRRIHGPNNFRVITIELLETQLGNNFRNFLANQEKYLRESLDKGVKLNPEIISVIGDSSDPKVVEQVYKLVQEAVQELGGSDTGIAATFDSDHSSMHVAKELAAYSDLVSPGQYMIIQDTYIGLFTGNVTSPEQPTDYIGCPLAAVEAFLELDNRFEIDMFPQRWLIVQSPFGYLKRKSM